MQQASAKQSQFFDCGLKTEFRRDSPARDLRPPASGPGGLVVQTEPIRREEGSRAGRPTHSLSLWAGSTKSRFCETKPIPRRQAGAAELEAATVRRPHPSDQNTRPVILIYYSRSAIYDSTLARPRAKNRKPWIVKDICSRFPMSNGAEKIIYSMIRVSKSYDKQGRC